MNAQEKKFDWKWTLAGVLLLAFVHYDRPAKVDDSRLITQTFTLRQPPEYHHQFRNTQYYLLGINEAGASFKISVAGDNEMGPPSPLSRLKAGDTLSIRFDSSYREDLDKSAKEIPIYGFTHAGTAYLDAYSYTKEKSDHDKRANRTMIIIGILLLAFGMGLVNFRQACLLGFFTFSVIAILRFIDKW